MRNTLLLVVFLGSLLLWEAMPAQEVYLDLRVKQEPPPLPQNFDGCVRILMDFNGRRGFYKDYNPQASLKLAKYACTFIRKNSEKSSYQDYLTTIVEIEQAQLAPLRVYCSTKRARLRVGHCLVGFFRAKDPQREMYYLDVTLPADSKQAYDICVDKGDFEYRSAHTHTKSSEFVVEKLYRVIEWKVKTPFADSRIRLDNAPYTTWKKWHIASLYAGKAQVIWINLRPQTTLKIYTNSKEPLSLEINERGDTFYLYKGNEKYPFIGNEVNLLEFE